MSLNRKEFLKTSGAAISVAVAGAVVTPAQAASPFKDDIKNALPSMEEVWTWEKKLASLCPTFTGTPGHNTFVDMLDQGMKEAGLKTQRQHFTFPYWKPGNYSLAIAGEKVHVPGYRPYSGPTGPDGVTAEVVYVGEGKTLDYSKAKGKIALIDVPFVGIGFAGNNDVIGAWPASDAAKFPGDRPSPVPSGMAAPDLKDAEAAGVAGVIYIWNGISDADAQDQIQPFFAPMSPVPALWAGNKLGQRLKGEAGKGTKVTLVQEATIYPGTPSETVWAFLPGMTDDVIVVNSHTDGCNACEENGGIAVMALARAMAKQPKEKRQKSYVFLGTTGHFSHGFISGAPSWQKENPEIMKKTVACLTVEHLGAIDYRDDAKGNYVSQGVPMWARAFAPKRPLADVMLKAAEASNSERTIVIHPHGSYPGEGASFFRAGIPTLSYITDPDYMTAAPPKDGEIGRLSKERMYTEIVTFARCLELMDAMSARDFVGEA